jgi:splicing factor U2AF 65 kDa subunit
MCRPPLRVEGIERRGGCFPPILLFPSLSLPVRGAQRKSKGEEGEMDGSHLRGRGEVAYGGDVGASRRSRSRSRSRSPQARRSFGGSSSSSSSSSRHRDHRDRDSGYGRRDDRDRDYHRDSRDRRGGRHRSRSRSPGGNDDDREAYRRRRQERLAARAEEQGGRWDSANAPRPPPSGFGMGGGGGGGGFGAQPPPFAVPPQGFGGPGRVGGMQPPPFAPPGAGGQPSSADRQHRRLYVGNIPPGISESELMEFFDSAMVSAGVGVTKGKACIDAHVNDKGFAFLEFVHPDDATAGIGFDGIMLRGHSLKVRRPSAFSGTTANDPAPYHGIASTNIPEGPEKIFMGGIPSEMAEDQVRELVSTFGALKGFNLVKDARTGVSKGFCFFQFEDPSVTEVAIERLNRRQVGDRELVVQRSTRGSEGGDAEMGLRGSRGLAPGQSRDKRYARDVMPLHTIPKESSMANNKTSLKFLDLDKSIPQVLTEFGITNVADAGPPTKVLVLANMINAGDTLNDRSYLDTFAEVRAFCEPYGRVVSVHIPRPAPRPGPDAMKKMHLKELKEEEGKPPIKIWGVGRIFVEFETAAAAAMALAALSGKYFDGRKVLPGYFREDKYEVWDFAPDEVEEKAFQEAFERASA